MNRETFLSFRPAPLRVEVPGRSEPAYVRVMSGAERMSWVQLSEKSEGKPANISTLGLVARCLCDETGTRLFTDSDEDLLAINTVDAITLDVVGKAALTFNGLGDEGVADAKKNSALPPSDSSSNSQAT